MIEEFDNTKFARASRKISKTLIGNPSSDIVDYTKQKHHKRKLNFTSYLMEHVQEKVRKLSSTALLQWKGVEQNCGAPPVADSKITENAVGLWHGKVYQKSCHGVLGARTKQSFENS